MNLLYNIVHLSLQAFALATSKVLNEGVNVSDASVAIILSVSGSTLEHIQHLGRILRKQSDKQATLYKVVARETTEEYTSKKRSNVRQLLRKSVERSRATSPTPSPAETSLFR